MVEQFALSAMFMLLTKFVPRLKMEKLKPIFFNASSYAQLLSTYPISDM
jgi:hypothetical protein